MVSVLCGVSIRSYPIVGYHQPTINRERGGRGERDRERGGEREREREMERERERERGGEGGRRLQ